jgi:hypothetical protein
VAPEIVGGTAGDQADIQQAINDVLSHLTTQITDDDLQRCIRAKATGNGKIFIGGDECYSNTGLRGYTTWTSLGPFTHHSNDVHLCLGNIRRQGTVPGATLMHEWAHTCGWDHGDGKGVPTDGHFRIP